MTLGVPKESTVQKVCRAASDEPDVRRMLDEIWLSPSSAPCIISDAVARNRSVFDLEDLMQDGQHEKDSENSDDVTTNSTQRLVL